jgi:integrase
MCSQERSYILGDQWVHSLTSAFVLGSSLGSRWPRPTAEALPSPCRRRPLPHGSCATGSEAGRGSLGRYPDIGLSRARELATEARSKIQQGSDVAREKQIANIERAAAKTFRDLAESYMKVAFPAMAANTIKQRRHHIDNVLVRKLGGLPARDVTTADIVALIEGIGQRSISVAELVFTAASEIFKHGVARHAVTANPCAGISVSAICGKREPRLRLKLTAEELRTVLSELPSIGHQNALTVRILLATCARISELATAKWEHVHLDRAEWIIPHSKGHKNKSFVVPLPPAVVGWFKELQGYSSDSTYVLPARQSRRHARHGGETHVEQRALNSMLHKLCDQLQGQVRRFTPHDLRSTARSHLSALGVNVIVAERCLNHSLGGLLAIYDQHDYLTERRAALEQWVDFILTQEMAAMSARVGSARASSETITTVAAS